MPTHRTIRRQSRAPLCAPAQYKDASRLPRSCQTRKSLQTLYDAHKIKHNLPKNIHVDAPEMWRQLSDAHPTCNKDEVCIVKSVLHNTIPPDMFAPTQPKDWKHAPMGDSRTFWTYQNIVDVVRQYERAYPHFRFIPPSYINYDTRPNGDACVTPELCSFSIEAMRNKGVTDVGIVFNTDTYGGQGIHWICVYIQLTRRQICYFDSLGDPPPKEIRRFVRQLKHQDPRMRLTLLTTPHQKLDGECGTYCVFALIWLLTGKRHFEIDASTTSWPERIRFLKHETLSDAYIQSFRDYFMRSNK